MKSGGLLGRFVQGLRPLLRSMGMPRLAWSLRRMCIPVGGDDLVLEIGSGASPFPRSDVLVDAYLEPYERTGELVADRPLVLGLGERLPFRSRVFDFAIACHVLEHSTAPQLSIAEMERVATAGLIETPTALHEALAPRAYHRSSIWLEDGTLMIYRKAHPDDFCPVSRSYRTSIAGTRAWLRFYRRHPELFRVLHFWRDRISFTVLNPDTPVDWTYNREPMMEAPRISRLWRMARALGRYAMRSSRKVDLPEILRCVDCGNEALEANSDARLVCPSCGREYQRNARGLFEFFPLGVRRT